METAELRIDTAGRPVLDLTDRVAAFAMPPPAWP